jgi:hypothetical protein
MKMRGGLIGLVILLQFPVPLAAQANTIILNSSPQGAGVYWQGRKLGVTPLAMSDKTAGLPGFFKPGRPAFDLYVFHPFHETEIETVKYSGAAPMIVTVRLRPLPRLPFYDGFYRQTPELKVAQVIYASAENLARLREEIFARYGRPIQDKRFVDYFKETRWYRTSPAYTDSLLGPDDRANLELINDFLEPNAADQALFKQITRQYEYRSPDGKSYLRFTGRDAGVIGSFGENTHSSILEVPYFYEQERGFSYKVAGGKVFVLVGPGGEGMTESVSIFEIMLDPDKKQFTGMILKGETELENN